jgi:hypothetical protein
LHKGDDKSFSGGPDGEGGESGGVQDLLNRLVRRSPKTTDAVDDAEVDKDRLRR